MALFLLGLCPLVEVRPADCLTPPSGLAHWWPGHGTAADLVGGAPGQLRNGASFASGKVGEGFNFGGGNERVEIDLDAPSGPYTVEAWIRFTADSFGRLGRNTILEFGDDAPWFGVRSDGTLQYLPTISGGQVVVGEWTHVAYSWDETSSRLYINGAQVAANQEAPPTTGKGLGLGTHSSDPSWVGRIDEVCLYHRALAEGEIAALFSAGGAGKCPPSPLPTLPAATAPYFTSFDWGLGPEWVAPVLDRGQGVFTSFTGRFGNQSQTLRVSGLTPGQSFTLGFDFLAIDSWDGNNGPDIFDVTVNDARVFHETFGVYGPPSYTRPPDWEWANRAFSGYPDALWRNIEIPFTATGTSAEITFQGQNLQAVDDESWGLDNVSVRLTSELEQTVIRGTTLPPAGIVAQNAIDLFFIWSSRDLQAEAAVAGDHYSLREAGGNKAFGDSDDTVFTLTPALIDAKTVRISFDYQPLQPGKYRFETTSGLLDSNGQPVAAFATEFSVAHPVLGRIENTDNNALESATALPVTETPAASGLMTALGAGTFSHEHDVDYWQFEANAGDVLSVWVQADFPGVYPALYLQNSAGGNLVTAGGDYQGTVAIQNYTFGGPGTYYLRVFTDSRSSPYQLRVDQARRLQLEAEGNDSQGGANTLALAVSTGTYQGRVAGAMPERDTAGDWFRLGFLNVGNAINVQLALPNGTSLTADTTTLAVEKEGVSGSAATSNTGLLNFTVAEDGIYFVRVFSDTARGLRAQYLLYVNVVDGVPPTVASVNLPAEGASVSDLIDRFTVTFSEPVSAGFVILGRRHLIYKGHGYLPTSGAWGWETAEAEAQSLGGHLVTIDDAEENEWVRQTFTYLGELWIGFTDRAQEGAWVWADGSPVTYTAWNGGEPNNWGGENYAMMYTSGPWNDAGGGGGRYGVIEVAGGGTDTDSDGLPDGVDPFPDDPLNGFAMRAAGVDGVFETSDDQLYQVAFSTFDGATVASFFIPDGPLQPGKHRLEVTTSITDRAGNRMAERFLRHFTVIPIDGFPMENRKNHPYPNGTSLSLAPSNSPDGSFVSGPTVSGFGRNPHFLVKGKWDADVHWDVAVPNYNSSDVSVLTGNGDGTFLVRSNYVVGPNPIALAVGDLNGDGSQDLVSLNYGGNSISVLLGNGDGSFQGETRYGAGANPRSAVIGDFNGDGRQDVAVANLSSANVGIYLGTGDGALLEPQYVPAGNGPHGIALGDLNQDGKPDLVVAGYYAHELSVLLGNADGSLAAPVAYSPGGNNPRSVATADLDGDGKLDVAVLNAGANTVGVLLGNGDGTLKPATVYGAGSSDPYHVVTSDLNADNRQDVVVASYGSARVTVLLGNGDGSLQSPLAYNAGGNSIGVAVADFNEDGRMDIAAANHQQSSVGVLFGNGSEWLALDPAGTGMRIGAGRGNLSDGNDNDYWSFTAKAGDRLLIAADTPGNPGGSSLYYDILYPDGNGWTSFVGSGNGSYNGWWQAGPLVAPADGRYAVRVRWHYAYTGEYRLRVATAPPPAQIESEDNNGINQANRPTLELSAGRQRAQLTGYLGVGDPGDYFYVGNLAPGTAINLDLATPAVSGVSTVLSVLNSAGTEVAASAASENHLTFTVGEGQGGAYYARVLPANLGRAATAQRALYFDGGSTYVDLGAWSPGSHWTVEAWVSPLWLPGGRHTIMAGANDCRHWGLTLQEGRFGVAMRPPGGCYQSLTAPEAATVGEWVHVAGTCDGTAANLYVNGVLKASAAVDPEYSGTTAGARIGSEVCCGGTAFPGLIEEVRVWDRALTAGEIQGVMTSPVTGGEAGLLGAWRLKEGSGNSVADVSAQGRHGTVQGAQWVAVGPTSGRRAGLMALYLLDVDLADVIPPTLAGDTLPAEGTSNPIILDRFGLRGYDAGHRERLGQL
jgi:hypothetical protein